MEKSSCHGSQRDAVLFSVSSRAGYVVLGKTLKFEEWADKIQSSFEQLFWIDVKPNENNPAVDSKLVHRRGMYKDCYLGSHPFANYQLRPNFPIAMAVVSVVLFISFQLNFFTFIKFEAIERAIIACIKIPSILFPFFSIG